MSWIKVKDFTPPPHEIILFRDRHGNDHYGVLCGESSQEEKRNKFWCHIFQKTYLKKDVIYWCEIPINKYFIIENNAICMQVNAFLHQKFSEIEDTILNEFQEHLKENPHWPAENFVSIAVRNCVYRMMQLVRLRQDL